jgi:predicted transcriptional regulator
VKANTKLEDVAKLINEQVPAVIVEAENGQKQILTRQDIIASLA